MIADPMERDERIIFDREEEDAREQRWVAFVAEAHVWIELIGMGQVLVDVGNGYLHREDDTVFGPGRFAWHAQQFAETDGWPDVLSALARAMKESGQSTSAQRSAV